VLGAFSFKGEIGRLRFVAGLAAAFVVMFAWAMVSAILFGGPLFGLAGTLGLGFPVLMLLTNPGAWLAASVACRRWRSIGVSPAAGLIAFVLPPVLAFVVAFIDVAPQLKFLIIVAGAAMFLASGAMLLLAPGGTVVRTGALFRAGAEGAGELEARVTRAIEALQADPEHGIELPRRAEPIDLKPLVRPAGVVGLALIAGSLFLPAYGSAYSSGKGMSGIEMFQVGPFGLLLLAPGWYANPPAIVAGVRLALGRPASPWSLAVAIALALTAIRGFSFTFDSWSMDAGRPAVGYWTWVGAMGLLWVGAMASQSVRTPLKAA
jgi:uncharacterized membrane protein YhaH (DUF805 family)